MLFLSTCLFLKNPDLRGNGAETQKVFFFRIRNFVPNTIEMEPKLLQKVLDGYEYFPVYIFLEKVQRRIEAEVRCHRLR